MYVTGIVKTILLVLLYFEKNLICNIQDTVDLRIVATLELALYEQSWQLVEIASF